jgi:hypothetical protein
LNDASSNQEGPDADSILEFLYEENKSFSVDSFETHCARKRDGKDFVLRKVDDIEEQNLHCSEMIVEKLLSADIHGTTEHTNLIDPCWSQSHFEKVPTNENMPRHDKFEFKFSNICLSV